jgi:hypothetical protein
MKQPQYELTFQTKDDYLFVQASGVRTRETVADITMKTFEAATARNLSLVLVDVRALEGRLGVGENYILVSNLFQSIRGKGLKKAAILDVGVSLGRGRFLETVARNRGYNFRIFVDQDQAVEWLMGDSADDS